MLCRVPLYGEAPGGLTNGGSLVVSVFRSFSITLRQVHLPFWRVLR